MLNEALMALAAAGGVGVVQAASTDAWVTFRQQLASLLGRGDSQRERVELERLDISPLLRWAVPRMVTLIWCGPVKRVLGRQGSKLSWRV